MKFSIGNIPWNKGMAGFVHQGSFKKGYFIHHFVGYAVSVWAVANGWYKFKTA